MKCSCYETDWAFIFCVEDVENAQLDDVILHMAWKKTDGRFLLSYPQSAFSDQREKELVGSNFSRLGPVMFEALLSGIDWEAPLEMIAQRFDENGIEWYIVGSAGDALRGVGVKPFDIDIVVHTRDYYRAKDICHQSFPDSIIAPFTGCEDISPSIYFDNPMEYFINPLKYFGRMFLAGAVIEVAADETWDLESRQPGYEKTLWRGYSIYVESLQHRYQIEIARNRGDRIKAFEEYMNRLK
ncbi:MAG: hypothetical protein GX254_01500 [Clostridiales bacterium]|jgi:hypothetical protein|nr:hypothetical protein [Clostridiales bacterium]